MGVDCRQNWSMRPNGSELVGRGEKVLGGKVLGEKVLGERYSGKGTREKGTRREDVSGKLPQEADEGFFDEVAGRREDDADVGVVAAGDAEGDVAGEGADGA